MVEIKYDLRERTPDGFPIAPTLDSEYAAASPEQDERGVVSLITAGGQRYYHPFSVASQALGDNGVEGTAGLYLGIMIANRPKPSEQQLAALNWLVQNRVELGNGAVTWTYPLPLHYSTFSIHPGWPSAFSQARIIHALIYAARTTECPDYLDLAVSAAKAYQVGVDQGGLLGDVDGLPFYEEVPVPAGHSPHILNGHLYSCAVLFDVADETNDPTIRRMASQGVESAKRLIHLFDTGYWTRYDLVPKQAYITFIARGADVAIDMKAGTISAPGGEQLPLQFYSASGSDTTLRANLPGSLFLKNISGHPGYRISLSYSGDLTGFGTQGTRPEVTEYYQLTPTSMISSHEAKTATFILPFQYLDPYATSRIYQRWHSRLMTRLAEHCGHSWLRDVAARWMDYDNNIEACQNVDDGPPPLRPPPEGPIWAVKGPGLRARIWDGLRTVLRFDRQR